MSLKGVWFQSVKKVEFKMVSNLPFKFNLCLYTEGLWATSQQVGGVLSTALAAFLLGVAGWR